MCLCVCGWFHAYAEGRVQLRSQCCHLGKRCGDAQQSVEDLSFIEWLCYSLTRWLSLRLNLLLIQSSDQPTTVYYTTVSGVIHLKCNMYNSICGDDYPICLSGSIGGALSELVAVC